MRSALVAMLLAVSVASSLASTPEPGVQPPPAVLPGVNADPTIVVFGDTYYLYPTTITASVSRMATATTVKPASRPCNSTTRAASWPWMCMRVPA
jgi:hypothetical protein